MRYFLIIYLLLLICGCSIKKENIDWCQTSLKSQEKINRKYKKYALIRTSNNDSILKKYTKTWECLGAENYIVTLQQKFKLNKINDTLYQIQVKNPDDTAYCQVTFEDGSDLDAFVGCPIGKPNGAVILLDKKGNKLRETNYKNEMKNGEAFTSKFRGSYSEMFINDVYIENK